MLELFNNFLVGTCLQKFVNLFLSEIFMKLGVLIIVPASFLFGCASSSSSVSDFSGSWKPLNELPAYTTEIPLVKQHVYQVLQLDSTVKGLLERWADEAHIPLVYDHTFDFTLFQPVLNIRQPSLSGALEQLTEIYSQQGMVFSVQDGTIVARQDVLQDTAKNATKSAKASLIILSESKVESSSVVEVPSSTSITSVIADDQAVATTQEIGVDSTAVTSSVASPSMVPEVDLSRSSGSSDVSVSGSVVDPNVVITAPSLADSAPDSLVNLPATNTPAGSIVESAP